VIFPDGQILVGSGAVVDRNSVLTASHVVYAVEHGGAATSVTVYPGHDFSDPLGSYRPSTFTYYRVDADGDGKLTPSDSNADVAILHFTTPIGDTTGWFGLDPNFAGGPAHVTGFPGVYGNRMTDEVGPVTYQNGVLTWTTLNVNPGNSGGPVWVQEAGGPYVVGLVSTTGWAWSTHNSYYDAVLASIRADDVLLTGTINTVKGTAANDTLAGHAAQNDVVDGLGGRDTFREQGLHTRWTLGVASDGSLSMSSGTETDSIANVERIRFDDGVIILDAGTGRTDPVAAQAYRLYQAAFARSPDEAGLRAQINALESSLTLLQLANNFIGSAEFKIKYGTGSTDNVFATALYSNVLGRAPDAAGLKVQTDALASGLARAQLLVNFSESAENVTLTGINTKFGLFSAYPDPAYG
ncbi:MAG: hypothetical protein JWM77_3417, partial [Rhodospirillales bacterium]|nr:hypothetical protein [Rhodospirillales bacterium]